MNNPVFYVGDLTGITFSMSETENASYPLANLSTYIVSDQWKSSSNTNHQTLKMDFGSSIARDTLILANHNINVMGDVTLEVDSADSPTFSSPVVVAHLEGVSATLYCLAFASVTKRYFRINFTETAAHVPAIGQIFVTRAFDAGYTFIFPYSALNEQFNTSAKRAISGLMRTSQVYAGVLKWSIKFEIMPESFKTNWQRFHQKVRGMLCPFYYLDQNGNLWYNHLSADSNDVEAFRYQLNNTGTIGMESQGVNQNPLS